MDKQQIRKKLLEERLQLENSFVQEATGLVLKNIKTLSKLEGKVIALYSATRNEVETEPLFTYLKDQAKTLVFPRNYSVPHKKLKFYTVSSLSELKRGKFGILEPEENPQKEVQLSDIHVYFIPGVAFDVMGNRIGYGSGYYDRALSFIGHKTLKIGLVYDFQVMEKVVYQKHDVAMDKVVTEKRIIECSSHLDSERHLKMWAKEK